MPDTARHLEKADKFLKRGRPDAALREYLDLLQEEPTHEAALQAAADLSLTLGHRTEAGQLLRQILEHQVAARSDLVESTYKKLLRVATVSPELSLEVARHVERTNRKESLEIYSASLRGFIQTGRATEALSTAETVVALEPNVENLKKVAELAAGLRELKKAITALLRAAGMLAAADSGAALELYERAHTLQPSDLTAALAYARALLAESNTESAAKAIQSMEAFASGPTATHETRAVYGCALLAAGRIEDVHPFLSDVLKHDPNQVQKIILHLANLLDRDEPGQAVELARRIGEHQQHAGKLRDYARIMRDLADKHAACAEFQEYLADLFNSTNREHDYCQALSRLFELHYASGNYLRAGDCLDRAAEIDPYETGHKQRLNMLRGKLDAHRFQIIANRLNCATVAEKQPATSTAEPASDQETTVLEDLMLQAEIFLQYSLPARAAERLERIRKLFPDEELKNQKLRELYVAAGLPLPQLTAKAPEGSAVPATDDGSINDISRVTEIARSIHRQGTIKSVLFTAVNEAGRHWRASRCVAVLCTPGKPPSIALEYCAPGIKPYDAQAIVRFIGLLQPLAVVNGPLSVPACGNARGPAGLNQLTASLGISSLLAMPLMEGEEHVGMLLLADCGGSRRWSSTDMLVLKNLADQTVLAVSNARLRRLVKNLAVTDEKSGLIKRSSYIDVLMSEVRRTAQQKSTLTVMLMTFGRRSELELQMGEAGVESMMQQAGQLVCSHIRQNDLAVRYDLTTLALVLADTTDKNAFLTLDQLRKVLGNNGIPAMKAGIAEAMMQPAFDPADIVTELINRVDVALQVAFAEGLPAHAVPATLHTTARA